MLLIARTDAESARLISSTIDVADHPFVMGTTNRGKGLAETLAEAERTGMSGPEIDAKEKEWMESNTLVTFNQGTVQTNTFYAWTLTVTLTAVAQAIESSAISNKDAALEQYLQASADKSISDARSVACEIVGEEVFWDWDCKFRNLDK
jgi:isocitrate lyase